MRTTLTLADDVAAALEQLRRDEGIGISEAANRLIRRGMAAKGSGHKYRHRSVDVGIKIDVTNVGDVLELLDEQQ